MKKQLLNERQVRKMMKFANIGALSDGFIDKLNENELMPEEQMDEEEGTEENLDEVVDEEVNEENLDEEALDEDLLALAEALNEEPEDVPAMGGEEEFGPEGGEEPGTGEDEEPLCSAITALKALKFGLQELDPAAADKIQIDLESEEEAEPEVPEEEMPEMPPMGAEEEPVEENANLYEARRRKRIISKVTQQVAKRLMKAKKTQ